MEIEDSGDPMYQTYFMVDWGRVKQNPSEKRCLACGGEMVDVEPIRDKKGLVYNGLACHKCKTILWIKQ